jgi:hypothetical protein
LDEVLNGLLIIFDAPIIPNGFTKYPAGSLNILGEIVVNCSVSYHIVTSDWIFLTVSIKSEFELFFVGTIPLSFQEKYIRTALQPINSCTSGENRYNKDAISALLKLLDDVIFGFGTIFST